MLKNNDRKEIEQIISKGYELELVSLEFDIPMEELRTIKRELDKNQEKTELQKLRERYKKLYLQENESAVKEFKKNTEEEKKFINEKIEIIEDLLNNISEKTIEERRKIVKELTEEIAKLKKYQLSLEQAEKLYDMLGIEELKGLNRKNSDKMNNYIRASKRIVEKQIAENINILQSQTTDIEELRKLDKKLTLEMTKRNPIAVATVKNIISNRILEIQTQKAIKKIKEDVPIDIENIIKSIANDTLNLEEAKEIINEEVKKRKENKPKNKFVVTEKQERNQILVQIRKLLKENPEKYHINNPNKAIIQIQKLCGGEIEQAIGDVVQNLLNEKRFDDAMLIYESLSKDKDIVDFKYKRKLKNEIENAKIGNKIMEIINSDYTVEEDKAYYGLIKSKLERDNIKLSSIKLGKSQNGLKNITLKDIWNEEEKGKQH